MNPSAWTIKKIINGLYWHCIKIQTIHLSRENNSISYSHMLPAKKKTTHAYNLMINRLSIKSSRIFLKFNIL